MTKASIPTLELLEEAGVVMNTREIEFELNRRHGENYSYKTVTRTLPELIEAGLVRKPESLKSYEITDKGKRYLAGELSDKESENLDNLAE